MDEYEAAAVRQERTNMEQMDKLIQLLLGKSDEDFATFLRMLRTTNNEIWAEELEKKAEQFSQREAGMCVYIYASTFVQVAAAVAQILLPISVPRIVRIIED